MIFTTGITHPGALAVKRNPDYEQQFLENVVSEADRRYGVQAEAYVSSVRRRLEIGAERYGDDDFLSKDNMRELLEETPDVCAYALLEVQKQLAIGGDEDGDRAWHLFEASVLAAAADYHARMARRA